MLSNSPFLTSPSTDQKQRLMEFISAAFIGVSTLIAIAFWTVVLHGTTLFILPIIGLDFSPTSSLLNIFIGLLAFSMGILTIFVFYMRRTKTPLTFLDINLPTRNDILYIFAGLISLFSILLIVGFTFQYFGVETTSHSVESIVSSTPELILLLVPVSILIIGPLEELLYRNIIQKSLYRSFSPFGSIFLSSVIFAAVHMPAYSGESLFQNPLPALNTLFIIFILSFIIGIVYHQTKNLVAAALLHGIYDSIIFSIFYINVLSYATPSLYLHFLS